MVAGAVGYGVQIWPKSDRNGGAVGSILFAWVNIRIRGQRCLEWAKLRVISAYYNRVIRTSNFHRLGALRG